MLRSRVRLIVLLALLVALLTAASAALAEIWYCPVCGLQNSYNFCPRDGTAKPLFNTTATVTPTPSWPTPTPGLNIVTTAPNSLPVYGLATMKVATRTGPSTSYTEPGTYRVEGQYLPIYSITYDDGSVPWVECEVTYGGAPMRVYTGLKRFDTATFDLSLVPELSGNIGKFVITSGTTLRYGPGNEYATMKISVSSGMTVEGIKFENRWLLIEFKSGDQLVRGWLPEGNVTDW